MNANALRTILLVKAIEKHDTDGTILPPAEREAATREALRSAPASTVSVTDRAWAALEARATDLYGRMTQRHPVVARAVALESTLAGLGTLLFFVALGCGLLLSLGDSRVRIELLAFPLLGLVLWNLVVYGFVAADAWRHRAGPPKGAGDAWGLATWPVRWTWQRAATLVKRAAFYHRPLGTALRKFADDWWPYAQPALGLQARRGFHLCAAAFAVGLVAGYYVRGLAFEYRAGWESTFLGPGQVGAVLRLLYGPASLLTGIALPADTAAVEALRWRGGAGGGPAAPWINLMAVTALLYVVVPRTLLALASSLSLARFVRTVTPPEDLQPYLREVFDRSDAALPPAVVRVTAYAYRPDASSVEGLQRVLRAAFGRDTQLERAPDVAYGDETDFAVRAPAADVEAMVFSLAATPEDENHGSVLTAVRRDARRPLVLVDESPFLARMRGDATLEARIAQRRDAWRRFVTDHGLVPCLVDLAPLGAPSTDVPADVVDGLRRGLRVALT